MSHLNIEIKARLRDIERVRWVLKERVADFKGEDHQVDTYFKCSEGRFKLREGDIENSLIHYSREDRGGPKASHVTLYHPRRDPMLKEVLAKAMGVLAIVDKRREIYFIDNVKFHIDDVKGLGSFVEIEALDLDGTIGNDRLQRQCEEYMELFGVREEDLLEKSYSDMVR